MNERDYLNKIFDRYVQTRELLELKEEVYSNLTESVKRNCKNGLTYEQAFQKSISELGDLTQILSGFAIREKKIIRILYYVSLASILFGFCAAIITYVDDGSKQGLYYAFGDLLPFCIAQTAYIIWYKVGQAKKNVWCILMGISSCGCIFFIYMLILTKLDCFTTYKNISIYLVFMLIGLGATIYSYIRIRNEHNIID